LNGALVILLHDNLEEIQENVEAAGGVINVPIFSFPGGKRFHFIDPSGNELAIWAQLDE
jgi:predicted enzyme related to lactoylglutathione lyase